METMGRIGIDVLDLHAFAEPILDRIQLRPGNIHFNSLGYHLLGEQVANAIRMALNHQCDQSPNQN